MKKIKEYLLKKNMNRNRWITLFVFVLVSISTVQAQFLNQTMPSLTLKCEGGTAVPLSVEMIPEYGHFHQYEWQRWNEGTGNWDLVSTVGLTNRSDFAPTLAGRYRCRVERVDNNSGAPNPWVGYSDIAEIRVFTAPVLTNVIAPSVCEGVNFVANIDGGIIQTDGSPLVHWEWRLGGASPPANSLNATGGINDFIGGNRIPDLIIPNIDVSEANKTLTLMVRNECGHEVESPPFTITIFANPPPPTPTNAGPFCVGAPQVPWVSQEKVIMMMWK